MEVGATLFIALFVLSGLHAGGVFQAWLAGLSG
jgi:hypothetical protein